MTKIGEPGGVQPIEPPLEQKAKDTALKPRVRHDISITSPERTLTERISAMPQGQSTPVADLFLALENNNMVEFEKLIQSIDPKTVAYSKNPEGQTISHQAVLQKNITALLLLRSANGGGLSGITNESGETVGALIQTQGEDFSSELTQAVQKQNAALEAQNSQNLFQAIENDDQSMFEFLIHKVDRQKIASFRNAEGQTITHLIIEKQNIPAYILLRQSNESALGSIKNDKGETVSDSIEKQDPTFKNALRIAIVAESKRQGVSQGLLLEKAAIFLKMRLDDMKKQNPAENSPQAQHIKDLEDVISSMGGAGYCNGFAVAWLEMFVLNLSDQFYPSLCLLRDWDEQKESITPALTEVIDHLMQRIIFYQYDKSSVAKIIDADPESKNLPLAQSSKLSLFLDNPDFIFPIERLDIKDNQISTDLLGSLLKEGNGIQIGTLATHSIAVGQKNGSFFLYDSNYKGDEENFDPAIGGVKYETLEDLSKAIRYRLFDVFGKKGYFPGYTLSVLDMKKANHHYPKKSDILDKKKVEEIKAKKSLSALEKFNLIVDKNIKDLTFIKEIIAQLEITDINDGTNGSPLLNQVINSDSSQKAEIVTLLLEKGAELSYDEYDNTLKQAILSRNPAVIKLILAKDPKGADHLPDYMQDALKGLAT